MSYRRLVVALLVLALVFVAGITVRRSASALRFPAATEGVFARDGHYPGEILSLAKTPRVWGSWAGSDTNEGTLRIGPFPAPAQLQLAVSGYPHREANDLFLEMTGTNLRFSLPVGDVGERWAVQTFEIPFGWQARLVTLVAVDRSRGIGGWLAISEPLSPAGEFGFAATLVTWICNGLLLGVCFMAAARWLEGKAWAPPPWIALIAGGMVALAAYATFWAYFAHPILGRIFSCTVLGAAAFAVARTPSRCVGHKAEWPAVLTLLALVGLFYIGMLHLFSVERGFYDLAGNRFIENLPGDNRLSHDLATLLYHGQNPKIPGAQWLSSDRPPLQAGWQLLTWPFTDWLGFGAHTAGGTAAIWFQLLWIPAAYGLQRAFRLSPSRSCAWIAVMALSGFFMLHTVFTWPKLSAAAFVCGTFGFWVLPTDQPRRQTDFLVGAILAALGWLSHGGAAFSLLPLVPWIAWRAWHGEARVWTLAAGVFLLLAAPWLCYQKLSDPPGNRLLKWHLGGQVEIDARGTWQTIRENYRAIGWKRALGAKEENLRLQIAGSWRGLADFSPAKAPARRDDEFFHTVRALSWWPIGLLLMPLAALQAKTRRRLASVRRAHLALAAWTALTTVVWCLLMFAGNNAVIHQGSYALMVALFVLLSTWIDCAGKYWLVVIAVLQSLTLASTWAVSNRVVQGPLDHFALAAVFLAAVGFVVVAIVASCSGAGDEHHPDRDAKELPK